MCVGGLPGLTGFKCVSICTHVMHVRRRTGARGQMEGLGYLQSTLQVFPPPLVHREQSGSLWAGGRRVKAWRNPRTLQHLGWSAETAPQPRQCVMWFMQEILHHFLLYISK